MVTEWNKKLTLIRRGLVLTWCMGGTGKRALDNFAGPESKREEE